VTSGSWKHGLLSRSVFSHILHVLVLKQLYITLDHMHIYIGTNYAGLEGQEMDLYITKAQFNLRLGAERAL